jgi:hypothetical protein
MKNYSKGMSNNIRRTNWGKSPDFNNRRENMLDTSPDKEQFCKHKILTQKKGFKNYYSNENELNDIHLIGRKEYNINYLKIEHKVNNIFISACYDNPQRDQYLKIINEKRRQNPDKIIEFIIPQFPIFPPLNPYQNMINPYNQYGQYNPYMNMYMMPPPPQFFMQNPIPNDNKSDCGNNISSNKKSNNKINNNEFETPENQNYNIIQESNNNNQINVKINNTPNPNALLINNNDSKSNKSIRNSNSGNNIEENIHSSNTNANSNNLNNNNQSDD